MTGVVEPGVDVTGEMSLGVMGDVSAVVEWKVPNFYALRAAFGKYLDSPTFSIAGSSFRLRVFPTGCESEGISSFFLRKVDSEPAPKTVTFRLGVKCLNGDVLHFPAFVHTFTQLESSYGSGRYAHRTFYEDKTREDAVTFTCEVQLTPEVSKLEDPQRMEQLVELESLSSDFKNLLSSEWKCDVTVTVQGKEFRAHKAVLSARSPVFRAMFEHDTEEDRTGILPISDCDPDTFGEFLSFLYTGRLEEASFCTAYELYITADKYDVQQLKDFCADYLALNLSPENVCDVVVLADKFDDDKLRSSAQDFFNKNSLKIFLTSEWTTLMKNNYRLADKFLKEMASAATENVPE